MGFFKEIDMNSSERFVYVYARASQSELEEIIDSIMKSRGYVHLGNGSYERGSKAARFWLGGFYKYFNFIISLDASNPEAIKVGLVNNVLGLNQGGLLGINKMKAELEDLKKIFQTI